MGPAAPISPLIIDTLKKLERDRTVLLRINNRAAALLSVSRNGVFAVEKVPNERVVYMATHGYVLEEKRSAFDQMGWIEYTLTYDGMMILRANT